jgi:2-polyprenyl-3-methyl-5-hydroxy-6-metoxy-1,4-benzoquinol methylase
MTTRNRIAIVALATLMLAVTEYGSAMSVGNPGDAADIWRVAEIAAFGLAVVGVFLVDRWWALLPAIAPSAVIFYLYVFTAYSTPWDSESVGPNEPGPYAFLLLIGSRALDRLPAALDLADRATTAYVNDDLTGGRSMKTQSRTEHDEYRPFPNDDGKNSRQAQLEVPVLVRAMALPEGARILEVGCGRGIALPVLDRMCAPRRLVGLDVEGELLTEAAEHLGEEGVKAELCCGDVRRMPFDDESFDVVLDFGTLYHIARSPAALEEIARVLAPGGVFVYETKASQFLSHPVRSRGRRLPAPAAHGLRPRRWAMLWASRT